MAFRVDQEVVGPWIGGAGPLSFTLLVAAAIVGGWQMAFVLAACWLAEALVGYARVRKILRANAVFPVGRDEWASTQILCLASGFAVLCLYHLAKGVELPVEDPSLIRWLFGMSPFVAAFFALAGSALWLSMILLGRSSWWNRLGGSIKALVAAGLGFIAATWPLVAVQGKAVVDGNFLVLGGLGSGAAVIPLLFKPLFEQDGRRQNPMMRKQP